MAKKYLLRDSFLGSEITRLVDGLPGQLIGSEPVCLSVFQPTASGGDLVLLDADKKNLVRMKPGWGAHESFIDRDVGVTFKTIVREKVKPGMVKHYVENDDDVKRAIGTIYRNRFGDRVEVLDGHVAAGTPYELIFVCPQPDYANIANYRRVPRLGLIYSFKGLRPDLLLTANMQTAADKIMQVRLATLLEYKGKFCPKTGRKSREKGGRSALDIARAVAINSPTTMDERIFLAAKCLAQHHHFYPHDPVAVHLFRKLTTNPGEVFNRHGLQEFTPAQKSDMELDDLIAAVAGDIAYLIAACHQKTKNSTAVEERAEIFKRMEKPIRTALALLCGTYSRQSAEGMDYVTIQRPRDLNPDMGELPWPVFKFSQFITWASSAKAEDAARSFLESLHPEGPLHSRTAKRYNDTGVIQKKSDGTWQSDPHDEWCISYARARCTFEFLMERRGRLEQSPLLASRQVSPATI